MSWKYKFRLINPLIVFALALLLRLINVLAIGRDYYANLLSDASTYRLWATRLAAGLSFGDPAFQMGPLYPYFMAINLNFGIDFYGMLFLQAFLGGVTAICIYFIARKLFFSDSAGLISGILTALFSPFIFYDGLILSESLQLTFISISLLLLLYTDNNKFFTLKVIISGILIGLASLGRATVLIFVLCILIYWLLKWVVSSKNVKTTLVKTALIYLAGCFIGIFPATLHNLLNNELVLISTNSGINLYIGNNSRANGTYEEPPGLNLSTDFTGRKIAERISNRPLRGSEVSNFWVKRTARDMINYPSHSLMLLLKKCWLYFWYFEIPQAESQQIHSEFSSLFKLWLPSFSFIFILAVLALLSYKITESKFIVILLFIANLIGNMAFFVIGRYRLIGYLALLAYSGAGVIVLVGLFRNRNLKRIFTSLIAIAVCVVILYLPRPIDLTAKIASAYDNVGIYHFLNKQPEKSIIWYRKSLALSPNHSPTLNNLGAYFYTLGMPDSAQYYFDRSLAIDSTQDKTLMNLGKIARDRGDLGMAYLYYRKAKQAGTFNIEADQAIGELDELRRTGVRGDTTQSSQSYDDLLASAEKLLARGQYREAEAYFRQALNKKPDDIRSLNNLGSALQAQNKYTDAADCFNKSLKIAPDNAIVYNNLASAVYQMGMLDSALELWKKGNRLDPANQQIKNNFEFAKRQKAGLPQ